MTSSTVSDLPTALLIDGRERASSRGETIENINPATEDLLANVQAASVEDVDLAVGAARAAFEGSWRRTSGRERGRLLMDLSSFMERDAKKFHLINALENGTPPGPDVPLAIDLMRYYGGWADKIHGTVIPTSGPLDVSDGERPASLPAHVYTVREPTGVVGAICAWNAPMLTAAFKLAPALAAGCTVVLKTSEISMQAVLYLGRLITEAGFPPGVVNVLSGTGDVGAAIVDHPQVDHVTFTGSPEVGRRVAQSAAAQTKRVTLELGGKNPQLVFPDADLDKAAFSATLGVCKNQGQVCLSGSRILVHEDIYAEVVDRIAALAQATTVGDPLEPGTAMGALISRRQLERVVDYIAIGKREGARLVTGGSRIPRPGFFVQPTFFADADNGMRIAREEISGPVGTIIPFRTEQEAVSIANDTEYGLGATIWTSDLSRAHRLAGEIRAGAVSVNAWSPLDARVPHGGFKKSGIGRENGWAGLENMIEEKVVTIAL